MKIVSVVGSGRSNGNTERLVRALEGTLIKKAGEKNIELEIGHFSLSSQDVRLCRGCRVCFDKGEAFCPLKDDLLKIRDSIQQSGALILASPVYVEDVSGLLKNWIDRLAFLCHRPSFFGKYALILSTSGAGSSGHTLKTMKNALSSWGFHMVCASKFRMGARMENDKIAGQYGKTIEKCADKLLDSYHNKAAEKPSYFSLISFYIQQKYYRTSPRAAEFDRAFWSEKSWLDQRAEYYMSVRCGKLKMYTAHLFAKLIAGMFL